ncbi:MAG TPA: 23S rRNA pseudouridine(955/2504/2580) synthase RluC [Gammaproteobacteria bacterium]|nr:23S rRNA pseudouridine(955/2504/2580) synthase RluC [Gammaproteobacteria bacterium]
MREPCKKEPTPAQFVEINAVYAGQRIDNYLLSHLKGVPRSLVYRIVRSGEVRVNKGRIKAGYRLQAGDTVRIPPLRLSEEGAPSQPGGQFLERIQSSVLYEDDELLILNKPAGIAVHGGSGVSHGVIEALRALRPEAPFLELVHRLDRDTSGCLMIAKQRTTLLNLHKLLREGGVTKHYLALVKGRWRGKGRIIDAALRKNLLESGERRVKVSEEGKEAQSLFEPMTLYKECSLMQIQLMQGRTHQIRVHAAHAGHPIAGDSKYGDPDFNRYMKSLGLKRMFLHARSVACQLSSGRKVHVTAPLGEDLQAMLKRLDEGRTQ